MEKTTRAPAGPVRGVMLGCPPRFKGGKLQALRAARAWIYQALQDRSPDGKIPGPPNRWLFVHYDLWAKAYHDKRKQELKPLRLLAQVHYGWYQLTSRDLSTRRFQYNWLLENWRIIAGQYLSKMGMRGSKKNTSFSKVFNTVIHRHERYRSENPVIVPVRPAQVQVVAPPTLEELRRFAQQGYLAEQEARLSAERERNARRAELYEEALRTRGYIPGDGSLQELSGRLGELRTAFFWDPRRNRMNIRSSQEEYDFLREHYPELLDEFGDNRYYWREARYRAQNPLRIQRTEIRRAPDPRSRRSQRSIPALPGTPPVRGYYHARARGGRGRQVSPDRSRINLRPTGRRIERPPRTGSLQWGPAPPTDNTVGRPDNNQVSPRVAHGLTHSPSPSSIRTTGVGQSNAWVPAPLPRDPWA